MQILIVSEEGRLGQPKCSTLDLKRNSTLYRSLLLLSKKQDWCHKWLSKSRELARFQNSRDRKILPAPGTNQIVGSSGYCLLTKRHKNQLFYLIPTVAQKCHGNFNFITAISTSFTAISTLSRQFQFHHGNFNFVHGNFNFVTAISISPRQFQLCSRQFQLHYGNFNFTTTILILSRQFQLRSRQFQFQFHHRESTKVVKKK